LNDFRDLEKQKTISEDDREKAEEQLQDATNEFIRKVDDVGRAKEKEIMEI
jgi:ribosome recycling factor